MHRFLLIVTLLLSGCNLFSDNPLSDPAKEPFDTSIIGTWYWNEDSDSGYVHIGTDEARKSLLVTMVEFKNDGRMETTEFKGHTTALSSHHFLNLRWTKPQENDKGYFFVEYNVHADVLEGSFLDAGTFENAVKAGALKGEIVSGGIMPMILIRASQDELRKFVVQNVKDLAKDTFKLKKMILPNDPLKKQGFTKR